MDLVKAFDISFYQGSVDVYWFKERKAEGHELAIIQCWIGDGPNPYFLENALRAGAAGLKVATYVWPPSKTEEAVAHARNTGIHVEFIGIDVERSSTGAAQPIARLDVLDAIAGRVRPVVYSGPWAWRECMDDSEDFSDLPLWNATYVGLPFPESLGFVNYGGWSATAGWQFAGNVELDGVTVDLNIFDREWLWPSNPEEDVLTARYTEEELGLLDYLIKKEPSQDSALASALGPLAIAARKAGITREADKPTGADTVSRFIRRFQHFVTELAKADE